MLWSGAGRAMKPARLTIERLGPRGEGIARGWDGPVRIPYAVPGDDIRAMVDGDEGRLTDLISASPDRVVPFCPYFETCGGCAVQSVAPDLQSRWKRDLVVAALEQAGLRVPVEPCIDAHGAGRRRAVFHARHGADGRMAVGYMAARSHDLVAIDHCPILEPGMEGAVPAARAIAAPLAGLGKPLDIAVTATLDGLDVDLRGAGPLDDALERKLARVAESLDLARVSNHGRIIVTYRPPRIAIGRALVVLPPGAFLQATARGEAVLASLVLEAAQGAKRVADLFSGVGAFALRLAERADVLAVEENEAALKACLAAAGAGLRGVRGERRDLHRRPLAPDELNRFDAIVFDPPRAGAPDQSRALARSTVPLVVGVSCNAQTFARDAKVLVEGGYALERVTPVDQFRHSAHVELVGAFRRARAKKKRSLLG